MSIREVHAFTITCTSAYGNGVAGYEPPCSNKNLGPFFSEYKSEVPLPEGWGYLHLSDCGLTGYSRDDLYCGDCVARLGLEVKR
jgi:hypothetical protein